MKNRYISKLQNRWRNGSRVMTLIAVTVALTLSGSAFAQKKPGGGGTETQPSGSIYFSGHPVINGVSQKYVGVMRSDGSNKLRLPGVLGGPSHLTYGPAGHRWFLHTRSISGNYPNGQVRREIFLVREDGHEAATVQLTADANVQFQSVQWSPRDAFVSAIGRRWNEAGTVDPESVGLYAASVVFDAGGNPLGLDGAPAFVASFGTKLDSAGHLTYDMHGYDWSPNLQQIVYGQSSTSRLVILDLLSGNSRLLTSGASPLWSPDGSRIAFYTFSTADEVVTISPNGENRMTLVKGTSKFGVSPSAWSPTGGHLLYGWWDKNYASTSYQNADIYRITATGGSKTNLTSDIDEAAGAIGWR
jgi:hypothetical protein